MCIICISYISIQIISTIYNVYTDIYCILTGHECLLRSNLPSEKQMVEKA